MAIRFVRVAKRPNRSPARAHGVTTAVVIGETYSGKQIEALALHSTFVLGTPGRLVELAESGTAVFGKLRALVVDEGDRMLDMGFAPQLASLLRFFPNAVLRDNGTGGNQRLAKPIR